LTDFPFYDGRPTLVTGKRWWTVMLGLVAGYAALILVPVPGIAGVWVRAILFAAIPLFVFARVVPRRWRAIFRPLRFADLGWVVLFTVTTVVVLLVLGLALSQVSEFDENPLGAVLAEMSPGERVLILVGLVPQLFGEELLSLLPFLALLYWAHRSLRLSRTAALWLASFGAVLIFGAVHLPTYDWNLLQCFVVVGSARIVLLAAYFTTKNIWVPTATHVLTDWSLFGLSFAAG
jgi:uncharacterized protein